MKKNYIFTVTIVLIVIIHFSCFSGEVYAGDGFTQKDRELLIELRVKMVEIDKRFEQIDKRFEQIDKRFEELREDMNRRFEQVDKRFEQVDKRFEQVDKRNDGIERRLEKLETVMMWGFGLLFTSMLWLVGFVLWDRRTTVAPVARALKEQEKDIDELRKKEADIERRERDIEDMLREYAQKEPRLAELMRIRGMI